MVIGHRRYSGTRLIVFGALLLAGAPAMAQGKQGGYPNRPVRFIVNYPPGGPTDLTARTLAPRLLDLLGQQFIVNNRPSASGAIGSQMVAKASPDGYTVMLSTSGQTSVIAATRGSKLPFDPFRDFTPVSLLVKQTQLMIAHTSVGVRSVADVVKLAKAKPKELTYASVGQGGTGHLAFELLSLMAGVELTHVPYKGTAAALADLTAGRVQLFLSSMPTVLQHVKAGKLVMLSVGTTTRNPLIPEVPTMIEAGFPGWEVLTWYGMFAPARTPSGIVSRLNAVVNRALADPEVIRALTSQGAEPAGSTPEGLGKLMRDEYERWTKLVRDANLKFD